MLWIALVVSSIILLASIGFAWLRSREKILITCGLGFFFCGLTGSVAILIQCALTAASTVALGNPTYGVRNFSILASLSMIVGFVVVIAFAIRTQAMVESLKEEFPVISLGGRLPDPPKGQDPYRGEGTRYEVDLPDKSNSRENQLRRLHDTFTTAFVNSPGFGIARFPQPPTDLIVHPAPDSVPQPVRPGPVDAGGEVLSSGSLDGSLSRIHTAGIVDFVNQAGFGSFRSRTDVIGFRPHRFSKLPDGQGRWAIRSVELISLLKHDPPAVYVSDNLPRMDQLAGATVRPLLIHERDGLEAIRKGEFLYAREAGDSVVMVGAVRSVTACVNCHGGTRGDLLGAFSYRLKKE